MYSPMDMDGKEIKEHFFGWLVGFFVLSIQRTFHLFFLNKTYLGTNLLRDNEIGALVQLQIR